MLQYAGRFLLQKSHREGSQPQRCTKSVAHFFVHGSTPQTLHARLRSALKIPLPRSSPREYLLFTRPNVCKDNSFYKSNRAYHAGIVVVQFDVCTIISCNKHIIPLSPKSKEMLLGDPQTVHSIFRRERKQKKKVNGQDSSRVVRLEREMF
jgi:hypothetical protein